jgi:carbon storage regulator CsrA
LLYWGTYSFGRGDGPVLVLTRKSNQSIMIGDDIEISVLAVLGEKVRIGIEAARAIASCA